MFSTRLSSPSDFPYILDLLFNLTVSFVGTDFMMLIINLKLSLVLSIQVHKAERKKKNWTVREDVKFRSSSFHLFYNTITASYYNESFL